MMENEDDFWEEIAHKLKLAELEPPALVLSPRQKHKYLLALQGVHKFQYVLEQTQDRSKLCVFPEDVFDQHFESLFGFGLVSTQDLEEAYLNRLPPEFMSVPRTRHELFTRLGQLINTRKLSPEFLELWEQFIRCESSSLFLEALDFYKDMRVSLEENNSSIVEKYIYALWMDKNNYTPKKKNKGFLGIDLSIKITEYLEDSSNTDWYRTHCDYLINSKNKKLPLVKTVTDMTFEEINEFSKDGFLTSEDFKALFRNGG